MITRVGLLSPLGCAFAVAISITNTAGAVTLSELYQSVSDHPQVVLARGQQSIAESELELADWGYYPSLSVDALSAASDGAEMAIAVEQPVFNLGGIDAQVSVAEAGLDVSKLGVDESELSVKNEILLAYFALLNSQKRLEIALRNEKTLEELLATMKRRVEQEISSKAEEILVSARLEQARSEIKQLEGAILIASSRIESAALTKVERVDVPECSLPAGESESAIVDEVLDKSPLLLRLSGESKKASAEAVLADSDRLPQITIGAKYSQNESLPGGSDSKVYLGFSYRLQNGFSINSTVAAAEARVTSARYAEALARLELQRDVVALIREYNAAAGQIVPLKRLVEANNELMGSYYRQYSAGRKTWLDVVNAQRELIQAEFQLSDTYVAHCRAAASLELLTDRSFLSY